MIDIDFSISPNDLQPKLDRFWELSAQKIEAIQANYDHAQGSPVFTVDGKYSTMGWTEWTQGFEFGSSLLQYDATGTETFLKIGRNETVQKMATHISHIGVHDHGFNNLSTYGNLLRLMNEGKLPESEWERNFYELAIKISGAVQASRWTDTREGGFIYSFNGPHSLFVDTIRSCRILMVSHALGHVLQIDNDIRVSLLKRAVQHMESTVKYNVYYGEGADTYDIWGRTAHEAIFNTNDGRYRCPNAQQGYTGRSTWTRGLAWAMCGCAEELEFLRTFEKQGMLDDIDVDSIRYQLLKAAKATCDFYIDHTPVCGVPYWDTGAPLLHKIPNYLEKPADPYNDYEPVDSSAAVIGAQGLLRLGQYLESTDSDLSKKYIQAGLTIAGSILQEPYLSNDPAHQGLILHSIYHQPNGWDHVPEGAKIANGESSMWGDYHARELAIYLKSIIEDKNYYTFYNCIR